MYQLIDTIFRFVLMGFFSLFMIISFLNFKKAKDNELKVSAKYFLAMAIFFLASLVNYIQSEINLQFHIYPDIDFEITLASPPLLMAFTSIMFILIFIPSVLPVIYVIEKYFQKWEKPYVTLLGTITLLILIITIIFPVLTLVTLIISLISMTLMFILFLSLNIRMFIKSAGLLRKSAALMITGWILQLIALLLPMPPMPTFEPILAHTIALVGTIILFYGMKISSE